MCEVDDCQAFEAGLQDALDSRRDPRFIPQLAEHMHECLACRQLSDEFLTMEHLVSAAFADPVLVAERERIAVNNRRSAMVRKLVGTLAASVLFLVLVERGGWYQNSLVPNADVISAKDLATGPRAIAKRKTSEIPVETLSMCYELTSELPGIRPIRSSVDATLDLLQRVVPAKYNWQPVKRPGIGGRIRPPARLTDMV